jgi:hypothetical protein
MRIHIIDYFAESEIYVNTMNSTCDDIINDDDDEDDDVEHMITE